MESSITASATGENRIKVGVRMLTLLHRDREENTHLEINEAESNVFVGRPAGLLVRLGVPGLFVHERIYDECAADVVRGCLEGINGTVFVYGQTGSGKTYMMEGASRTRASSHAPSPTSFRGSTAAWRWSGPRTTRSSGCPTPRSTTRDPGPPRAPAGRRAAGARDGKGRRFFVEGLTFSIVKNSAECMAVFEEGKAPSSGLHGHERQLLALHAIFSIVVERTTIPAAGALVARCGNEPRGPRGLRARFHELPADRKAADEPRRVDVHQRSLAAGQRVHGHDRRVNGMGKHIPFRNSTLTKLLADSIAGHTHMAMVAALSPRRRAGTRRCRACASPRACAW